MAGVLGASPDDLATPCAERDRPAAVCARDESVGPRRLANAAAVGAVVMVDAAPVEGLLATFSRP